MGNFLRARIWLAVLAGALTTAGCASGGGGGAIAVSPPPPPPSPATYLNPPLTIPAAPAGVNTAEYNANYGVGATGAAAAWSRGYTGAGIKIGVVDDGIVAPSDPSYAELVGRIDTANSIDARSLLPITSPNYRNQLNSTLSHGSELSSLIAGNLNGQQTVGVAYGATILAVRTDNGADSFEDADLANGLNYAVSQNVKVVNFSLGSSAPIGPAFQSALANATAAGVIVVVSAGNDGPNATEVNYPGRFAIDASVGRGLMIVAGGVNADGTFNTRSNVAGSAANFYMTAPGWEIVVPDYGPAGPVPGFQACGAAAGLAANLCQIQGTSYASPQITGAVALLLQAFPGMTPVQIVQLILNSTDDQAAPGIDSVTGHGRLNLVKAFQPAGMVAVPLSAVASVSAGAEIGVSGAAFGDAFHRADNWRAVGFDKYGRSFEVSLAPSWRTSGRMDRARDPAPLLWKSGAQGPNGLTTSFALAETAPPAAAGIIGELPQTAFRSEFSLGEGRRMAFANGVAAAPSATPMEMSGHMAFAGYDHGAALMQDIGKSGRLSVVAQDGVFSLGRLYGQSARRGVLARVDYWRGPASVGASIGSVVENGSVLGTTWAGAVGAAPEAMTRFIGISARMRLAPGLDASVDTEFGGTKTSGGPRWLSTGGELITSAGIASLGWDTIPRSVRQWLPHAAGKLTFSVSQPLRVESGAFSVLLPTANDWGRQSLTFAPQAIPATPSGREIDTSVTYSLWAADNLTARVSATYASEPGHNREAPAEKALTFGMRYGF
ncbi:MAG TPA: S8 family peptidase [Caulobacterales bacterium]|nr:S8 family peptidase [Caulobacterales bacterium]